MSSVLTRTVLPSHSQQQNGKSCAITCNNMPTNLYPGRSVTYNCVIDGNSGSEPMADNTTIPVCV